MRYIDLSGQTFGQLYVIKRAVNKGRRVRFLCRCQCGNEIIVLSDSLKNGKTKSCGCLRTKTTSLLNATHGKSKTRLYHIWQNMKRRCLRFTNPNFKYYGGRGITICTEWKNSFDTFYAWAVSNGYQENLSIDRIDVNGNYCPSNCRFATKKEQSRNTRSNRLYHGKPISQLCEEYGLDYGYVRRRLNFYHDPESKFFGGVK